MPLPAPAGPEIGIDVAIESGVADSLTGIGAVIAPAANATIAQIVNVPAGIYETIAQINLSAAAPAVADLNNMHITGGPTNFPLLIDPAQNTPITSPAFRMTLAAPATIAVKAIGAGTAAVTYSALLVLRRVA